MNLPKKLPVFQEPFDGKSEAQITETVNAILDYLAEREPKKRSILDLSKGDKNNANMTKIQIKSIIGSVLFEHECEDNTIKKTLEEAVRVGADLAHADLTNANLTGTNLAYAELAFANLTGINLAAANFASAKLTDADMCGAKFFGKGGTTKINKSQVDDFFEALGVIVGD